MKTGWDIKLLEWFSWSVIAGFILLSIMASVSTCHGAEFSIGYGTQINWNPSWCSEATTHEVMEIEARVGVGPWTFGVVGQRLRSSVWPSHIVDGEWYEGSDTTSALHFRLGLQGSKGILIGRLFGGFGVHSGQQVELGDSGVLGHFGAGVGIEWGRAKLWYSLTHMSDPLRHHDFGWNYQMISIQFNF